MITRSRIVNSEKVKILKEWEMSGLDAKEFIVEKKLGIAPSSLCNWMNSWKGGEFDGRMHLTNTAYKRKTKAAIIRCENISDVSSNKISEKAVLSDSDYMALENWYLKSKIARLERNTDGTTK